MVRKDIKFDEFKTVVKIGKTFFYKIKKTVNTDKVFAMFNCDKLTTREKEKLLYKSPNLTNSEKRALWRGYMKGYDE
jgi:hypothetical protein